MAKPKVSTYTEKITEYLYDLWIDEPIRYISEIKSIEGVDNVVYHIVRPKVLIILIDKRYDAAEVMEEIITLLSAEVPDIFKEK